MDLTPSRLRRAHDRQLIRIRELEAERGGLQADLTARREAWENQCMVSNTLRSQLAAVKEAWAKQGLIPSFKLNGLLRFDQSEIEEWIRQSKVSVSNVPEIRTKRIADSDIDRIVSCAIDSVKTPRYNPSTKGKPDQNHTRRGGTRGSL